MIKSMYFVYILRCADGTLYTGITTDLGRRVQEHDSSDKGAKYTRGRRPVEVVYQAVCHDRSAASREEARIKALSREEKEALVASYRPKSPNA